MDEHIYTLANMRMRSALLVTAVLATGAQTQDVPGAKQLAQVLYKHAEGLLLLTISRNAKSPEIVQVRLHNEKLSWTHLTLGPPHSVTLAAMSRANR